MQPNGVLRALWKRGRAQSGAVRVEREQQPAHFADEAEGVQNNKCVVTQILEGGGCATELLRDVHAHNVTKTQRKKLMNTYME